MFLPTKRAINFLFFFLFSVTGFTQGFGVGYNIGRFTSPMRNMEVFTYEFNKAHPNYTDQYNFANFYRGLTFMYSKSSEKGGFEFIWSNKHIKADSKGADLPTDTVYKRQVKARMNMLSIGGFVSAIPNKLNFGVDYDIMGFCRFYKKIGPEEDFKKAKWEKIFDKKGFLVTGFTFFMDIIAGPIKIRPFYQWSILPGSVPYGLQNFAFKTTNYGVAGYLVFGKKDRS